MTKKTKKKSPAADSPLAKIGSLPKVGSGFGGYDIALGFSHRYALEIAADTLSELEKSERSEVFAEIYNVFEQWKNEHGVYPPNRGLLFALSGTDTKEQEPAREYIKRQWLAAELSGEKPKRIEAWECDSFARTPVRLFFKLLSEDYPPLNAPADRLKVWRYDYILAAVILMSDNPDSEYQSGDCIEGALKLAELRLSTQKNLIETMKPDAEAAFNRKRQKELSIKSKKEEKERKILSAYEDCLNEKGEGNFPYKEVAARAGIPESTVCKYLRNAGLGRYKTK